MGYHSARSGSNPEKFVCFDCRVHADRNWDLINVHGLYSPMMSRFRDLALFRYVQNVLNTRDLLSFHYYRRAIKVCEKHNPEGPAAFAKIIGTIVTARFL